MSKAEGLLISQAYTLDAIYNRLAQRAMSQEYLDHFETVLKLVLQAQFQCARTLEILSTIKNPPNVSFVKQANIAHNQQVNNVPQADQSSATRPPVIDLIHHWSTRMATTWTPERRQRQAEMIQQWRPWEKSTGPKTAKGKARVSRNAYKGGTWLLLRVLARVLKEQDRMLEKV